MAVATRYESVARDSQRVRSERDGRAPHRPRLLPERLPSTWRTIRHSQYMSVSLLFYGLIGPVIN